jgi:hypothetical protein
MATLARGEGAAALGCKAGGNLDTLWVLNAEPGEGFQALDSRHNALARAGRSMPKRKRSAK